MQRTSPPHCHSGHSVSEDTTTGPALGKATLARSRSISILKSKSSWTWITSLRMDPGGLTEVHSFQIYNLRNTRLIRAEKLTREFNTRNENWFYQYQLRQ